RRTGASKVGTRWVTSGALTIAKPATSAKVVRSPKAKTALPAPGRIARRGGTATRSAPRPMARLAPTDTAHRTSQAEKPTAARTPTKRTVKKPPAARTATKRTVKKPTAARTATKRTVKKPTAARTATKRTVKKPTAARTATKRTVKKPTAARTATRRTGTRPTA